jgi:predicted AlkP superfamily phosphohydrolase/phosphomutase
VKNGGTDMKRVIAIGLDGGELSVLKEMADHGVMPHLAKLLKTGFVSRMDTYVSGPGQGWASFITGKSPRKHGVFYWTLYKNKVGTRFIKDRFIWEILGKNGIRSCVVNMSYTYPARPMSGHLIAGLGSNLKVNSEKELCYPSVLMDELRRAGVEYMIGVDYKDGTPDEHVALVDKMIQMTIGRADACVHIMRTHAPQFVSVEFRGTDLIQHCYWNLLQSGNTLSDSWQGLRNKIFAYYSELDRGLGRIFSVYPDADRLVLSDHGFGPVRAIVFVNHFLSEKGFLMRAPVYDSPVSGEAAVRANHGIRQRLTQMVRGMLKSAYLNYLQKLPLFRVMNEIRERIRGTDLPLDHSRTVAFSDVLYGVTINRRSARVADVEVQKQQVMATLRGMRDPQNGEEIFNRVYARDESDLRTMAGVPDIILEPKEEYQLSYGLNPRDNEIFRYMYDQQAAFFTGNHRQAGICILGSDRKVRPDLADINITDMTATVLDLFDVKTPDDLDGRSVLVPKTV